MFTSSQRKKIKKKRKIFSTGRQLPKDIFIAGGGPVGVELEIKLSITLLVIIEAISNGYSSIAKTMTYYDQRLSRQIVEKIRMKCYNFRKILDLPNISDLPLSTEESKVLVSISKNSINSNCLKN